MNAFVLLPSCYGVHNALRATLKASSLCFFIFFPMHLTSIVHCICAPCENDTLLPLLQKNTYACSQPAFLLEFITQAMYSQARKQ